MTVTRHVLVVVLYTLLTCVMTWPVAMRVTTYVPSVGGDAWQTMWRFEAKAELLRELGSGHNELGTNDIVNRPEPRGVQGARDFAAREFLGGGEPRLVNLSVWPWMPVHVLFGEPVGYNVIWLLSFVLSGYAMYMLVRTLARIWNVSADTDEKPGYGNWMQEAPAFLAGMAYMFLPYHVAHAQGHFGAMQLQWMPLIILAVVSLFERPRVWKSVVLSLLLVVQAWTEHHYLLWLGFLAVITLFFYWKTVWWFVTDKLYQTTPMVSVSSTKRGSVPGWVHVAVVALVGGGLIVLSTLPTLRLALQPGTGLDLGREQTMRFSADLFSFITPAPFHSLWGNVSYAFIGKNFTGNVSEATQYLGISLILFVVFFGQRVPRLIRRYWVTVFFVFLVISLGVQLHVFGSVLPLKLPFDIIDSIPVLSSVRTVARAGAVVGLSGVVLLGLTLATHVRRPVSAFAVLAVIVLEFLFVPVDLQSAQLSKAYTELKDMRGDSVIEIPAATNYVTASRSLYAQTVHGKDVLGNIALERADVSGGASIAKKIPGVRQLLYLRTTELREKRPEFFNQNLAETLPDALAWVDARAVVLHTDSVSVLQYESIDEFLVGDMKYDFQEYDDVVTYRASDSHQSDGVFLMREDGWSNVGFDESRDSVFAEVTSLASVRLVNVTNAQKQVKLSYTIPPESHEKIDVVYRGETLPKKTQGGRFYVSVELQPGSGVVSFKNVGSRKAILQNPALNVATSLSK